MASVFDQVFRDGNTPCWHFAGSVTKAGYGRYGVRRSAAGTISRDLAHRVAYREARGVIPAGMFVLHSCDTPGCVNPDHLRVGTAADNMADKVAHGRQTHCGPTTPLRGERHPRALLSDQQVQEARQAVASGVATRGEISKAYGVSISVVKKMISRRAYKYLP